MRVLFDQEPHFVSLGNYAWSQWLNSGSTTPIVIPSPAMTRKIEVVHEKPSIIFPLPKNRILILLHVKRRALTLLVERHPDFEAICANFKGYARAFCLSKLAGGRVEVIDSGATRICESELKTVHYYLDLPGAQSHKGIV